MAALRSSKEFKELAARLTERGKKKMQIIAAAMHKLVRIAYGVLKNQQASEDGSDAAEADVGTAAVGGSFAATAHEITHAVLIAA